jgi:hypothetical protein
MKNKLLKAIALSLVMLLATTGVFAAVPGDVQGQSYEAAVSDKAVSHEARAACIFLYLISTRG